MIPWLHDFYVILIGCMISVLPLLMLRGCQCHHFLSSSMTWLWNSFSAKSLDVNCVCTGYSYLQIYKIWLLSYGAKTSRPIRMYDSLNYNISQTSWDMKLNSCMWLEILGATNFFSLFKWVWSGMPRHAQSYVKSWVSFISKRSWAIKLFLCMWLGIHRSYNFIQSFQVGVVRHV